MAPLSPSPSRCYSIAPPEFNSEDDRQNLRVRTGASTQLVKSRIFCYGGLTIGLDLQEVSIKSITQTLEAHLKKSNIDISTIDLNDLISNEVFKMNILERKWKINTVDKDGIRPKPRIFASIYVYEGFIYIHGGLVVNKANFFEIASDLWSYDISADKWICLSDGKFDQNLKRYNHRMISCDSLQMFGRSNHQALIITGGNSGGDLPFPNAEFFDLKEQQWLKDSRINSRPIEEIKVKLANKTEKTQKKIVQFDTMKTCLTILPNEDEDRDIGVDSPNEDSMLAFTSMGDITNLNPLIEFPLDGTTVGRRLPFNADINPDKSNIPFNLNYPNIGIFGECFIVMGCLPNEFHQSIYLYHSPTGKWSRLKAFCNHALYSHRITTGYVWSSHHKIVLLGNFEASAESPSAQYFNHLISVSLPFTNASSRASSYLYTEKNGYREHSQSQYHHGSMQSETQQNKSHDNSFMAYSRYVVPQIRMSSIKSVFPPHAVTLGKNAFERFGSSLSDLELVSAEGEIIPIPSVLCKKRWGRCFEILLAKSYVRAFDNFEKSKVESEFFVPTLNNEEESTSGDNTDSMDPKFTVYNSPTLGTTIPGDAPQFRLPFQDGNVKSDLSSPFLLPKSVSSSRKASVVSGSSSASNNELSKSASESQLLNNLPPVPPMPTESLPQLPNLSTTPRTSTSQSFSAQSAQRFPQLKSVSPSSSPRGSITGMQPFSQLEKVREEQDAQQQQQPQQSPALPRNSSQPTSLSSSQILSFEDLGSVEGISVNLNTMTNPKKKTIEEQLGVSSTKIEALLVPRSIYVPFLSTTVKAFAEFLSTGQVGSRWPIAPTTLDTMFLSKFYEVPLLYDLILEILYGIIAKKEAQIIKDSNDLKQQYISVLAKHKKYFSGMEDNILAEIPTVEEFDDFLNRFNNGFLDSALLKKISKARKNSHDSVGSKRTRGSVDAGSVCSDKQPASSLNSVSESLQNISLSDQKEELDEDDPKFKVDLTSVNSLTDDEFCGSYTSSSDEDFDFDLNTSDQGVDAEDEDEDETSTAASTTSAAPAGDKQESIQATMSKRYSTYEKPHDSTSSKRHSFSSAGQSNLFYDTALEQTWPTLGELTAKDARPCSDAILEFFYETGALVGDIRLMLRAANAVELSRRYNTEKKELSKYLEIDPQTKLPRFLSQQQGQQQGVQFSKNRKNFNNFDMGNSGGLGLERKNSATSLASSIHSRNSYDIPLAHADRYGPAHHPIERTSSGRSVGSLR
ncbi:hypothetical protein PACTADRAFT_48702 [Pachysolen tannophilus NRRL Y-2460]|uniref:Negative regulator of sporulation MDS3 n=1 Tax=Pachysolen tannophilus NRRL Y-2460 TaxID=669874 RepID=A0A1E4TYT1_PACTA|nr:hypothetical protein PACTADRAFT_48702 [Pachysolen tannophilus NRRL Y-2460]